MAQSGGQEGSTSPWGPGESTPLSAGQEGGLNASSIQGMASNMLTRENAAKAGTFAKTKAEELKKKASEGNISIRLLALIGGIATAVTSAMQFLGNLFSLKWFSAILNVYTFLLGVLVILLEGKQLPLLPKLEQGINKYFLLLKLVWGRGCVYFIAGTLQLSQVHIVNYVVGGFMCIVGIAYIVLGRRAAKKLTELRKELYSEHTLKAKFHEADSTGSGTLTVEEFKYLTQSLGMSLTRTEVEAAFLHLDTSGNGELTYDEFKTWWAEHDESEVVPV